MKIQWNGVMPAVTTKFKDDDSLDLVNFKINIQAQLNAGVNGIILGGTLGEASTLTDDEKRILTRETVAMVNGKIPVIVNIAEQSTKAAIDLAQKSKEDGASGLMMLPPISLLKNQLSFFANGRIFVNAPCQGRFSHWCF